MRYKLLPVKMLPAKWFEGTLQGALWEGEDYSTEIGCRVLVIEHPVKGIARRVGLVGKDPEPPRATKRKK